MDKKKGKVLLERVFYTFLFLYAFWFMNGFTLLKTEKIDSLHRMLPVGMSLEDVKRVTGEPDEIINEKKYEEYKLKSGAMERSIRHHPDLPFKKSVYVYRRNQMHYFVFFDDDKRVKMVFVGDSDLAPSWYP